MLWLNFPKLLLPPHPIPAAQFTNSFFFRGVFHNCHCGKFSFVDLFSVIPEDLPKALKSCREVWRGNNGVIMRESRDEGFLLHLTLNRLLMQDTSLSTNLHFQFSFSKNLILFLLLLYLVFWVFFLWESNTSKSFYSLLPFSSFVYRPQIQHM